MADEFAEKFQAMKELMEPSPELMARLTAALDADQGPAVTADGDSVTSEVEDIETLNAEAADTTVGVGSGRSSAGALRPSRTRRGTKAPRNRSDATGPGTRPRKKRRLTVLASAATATVMAAVLIVTMVNLSPRTTQHDYAAIYHVVDSAWTGHSKDPKNKGSLQRGDIPPGWASDSDFGRWTDGVFQGPSEGTGPITTTPDTGTNTQVEGIDEGDIVKTDGTNLYIAGPTTLAIVKADGAASTQLSSIDVTHEAKSGRIVDLMLDSGTAVVLMSTPRLTITPKCDILPECQDEDEEVSDGALTAVFYDVSDPTAPKVKTTMTQSGDYVTSRLKDGVLYLVSTFDIVEKPQSKEPLTFVPALERDGTIEPFSSDDVTLFPGVRAPSYTVATAITSTSGELVSRHAVLGETDTVYMAYDNLYLTAASSEAFDARSLPEEVASKLGYNMKVTNVVRLSLTDGNITVAARGVLPGTVLNQYSLDEYDGHLRAVTNWSYSSPRESWGEYAGLWIMDSSLDHVGSVASIVTNESVRSVHFAETTAYVVTFQQTDPLFTIDLSNPKAPEVQGALEIPGFSSYLHPFGSGLLLGIGQDGTQRGLNGGMKLSMFDVSDPYDVIELVNFRIDAYDSEISVDHKAVYVDPAKGLLGFAALSHSETRGLDFTQTVTLPDGVGSRPERVIRQLGDAGVPMSSIRIEWNTSGNNDNTVSRMEPTAGSTISRDTLVTLTVDLQTFVDVIDDQDPVPCGHPTQDSNPRDCGPVGEAPVPSATSQPSTVPGVVGMSYKDGVSTITDAGFQFNTRVVSGTVAHDMSITALDCNDLAKYCTATVAVLDSKPGEWNYHLFSWNGFTFDQVALMNLDGVHKTASNDYGFDSARGVRLGGEFYVVAGTSVLVYDAVGYSKIGEVVMT